MPGFLVARAAAEALKRTGVLFVRGVASSMARAAARKVLTDLAKEYGRDLLLDLAKGWSTQMLANHLTGLAWAAENTEKVMNARFSDDVMGIANIAIIAPPMVGCGAYTDVLLPSQLIELMDLTIRWGTQEADRLYEYHVAQGGVGIALYVMAFGAGVGSWCLGINFDPSTRYVERMQREWVAAHRRHR